MGTFFLSHLLRFCDPFSEPRSPGSRQDSSASGSIRILCYDKKVNLSGKRRQTALKYRLPPLPPPQPKD